MSKDQLLLTQDGYDTLVMELEELKTTKRRDIAERLKIAIGYGDLKENSEYHSAKNDQSFMETRIKIVENILRTAQIVDSNSLDASTVQVGSTVVLHDIEFKEDLTYTIVGPSEADVMDNKVSYESPLGKALMGKAVNDKIQVAAPSGIVEYKLLAIKIV
jgi:transcription elongation factor GreA